MSSTNQSFKPNNTGTKKLFDNPILEKLTHTHISVPIALLLAYAAGLIIWSTSRTSISSSLITSIYFIGLLFFTFAEYTLHRYVYHMKPSSDTKKKIQYTFHGVHHEYPKDKSRLAMPPILSLTISTVLLGFFHLIMGEYSFSFLAGFLTGYALYLFMHYILHAYPPPKNFFKKLWIYHSIHHYKDETIYYGVSSPLWDFVFGTIEKRKKEA
ncbi:sterol desaturase family protein [Aureibacter tunicatorum]|uniref:Sterol desaturase/sphingolipid hydroxylase (Fatty acid hydroxylase superfamily) n=1 Tax=Aureibacter tunicatorum TaxID=866807 RepID=A0AAE3XMK0_9BACT|nr:sterol desaturase family protein [Aureibacter tunicatorum]MDR6239702.1 sterol desaturase/sphingolipid hydroxylase (fatty acid hydroxylase superfamily) [Aureibacter tunicatorum]BDD04178.1 hypothetical protein AUTU_16610 [Aureibacter tunicatorum]